MHQYRYKNRERRPHPRTSARPCVVASKKKPEAWRFNNRAVFSKAGRQAGVSDECHWVRKVSFTHLTFAFPFLVDVTWQAKEGYLQGQIGNPDGEDKPNKKFYDPRVWVRKASNAMKRGLLIQ